MLPRARQGRRRGARWVPTADLSGNMVRSPRFPPEAGGGKLEHGLVPITFRTGNTAAVYRPRIIPLDGSSYAFTITAHE